MYRLFFCCRAAALGMVLMSVDSLIDDGVTSDRSRFVTRIDLPVRKRKI